jgi:hypothetical protein
LIVERLFRFVFLVRLVFSTLITDNVCSLGLGEPYSKRLFLRLLSLPLCPVSFSVCDLCSLVVGANACFSTVGIAVQVRVLSSVSFFHTDD